MTDPVWPLNVPFGAVFGSFDEEIEDNKVSSEPEAGPPIERRRFSMVSSVIGFMSPAMTSAQWQRLVEFYRFDTKDGTLPFICKHPRGEGAMRFKFMAAPKRQDFSIGRYQTPLRFRRMD